MGCGLPFPTMKPKLASSPYIFLDQHFKLTCHIIKPLSPALINIYNYVTLATLTLWLKKEPTPCLWFIIGGREPLSCHKISLWFTISFVSCMSLVLPSLLFFYESPLFSSSIAFVRFDQPQIGKQVDIRTGRKLKFFFCFLFWARGEHLQVFGSGECWCVLWWVYITIFLLGSLDDPARMKSPL